ncbi:MAG: metalloregulator ArsR/SmtB family transcription factor [Chloroflexota bacterium]
MTTRTRRTDDPERLRQFKAEFFKALAHPVRIALLELLRDGPLSVGELQDRTGVAGSSVSQQLAVLRGRGIVVAERSGTTVHYHVADPELFSLLDAARQIFYAHLSDNAELLRLVKAEELAVSR